MDNQPPVDRRESLTNTTSPSQTTPKLDTPASSSTKFDPAITQDPKDATSSKKSKHKTHKCRHCKACRDGPADIKSDSSSSDSSSDSSDESDAARNAKKERARRRRKALKRKSQSRVVELSSTDESGDSDSGSSSSDESSEDEVVKKSRKKKVLRKSAKKGGKKSKKVETDTEADETSDESSASADSSDASPKSESEDESSAEESEPKRSKKKDKKSKKSKRDADADKAAETDEHSSSGGGKKKAGKRGKADRSKKKKASKRSGEVSQDDKKSKKKLPKSKKGKKRGGKGQKLEFRRVDQLWDNTIHNFKLKESAEDEEVEFDEYAFTVRRTFDWENKYKCTFVDLKSKLIRDSLQIIMKDVKGVSLVEDEPQIDPNMLFLYLEEIRAFTKKTLKARIKKEKKRKARRRIEQTRSQLKLLIEYLDQDYKTTKKSLYPMLKEGTITFEYLWALFKPNTIAYTPTYNSHEHPRCFKVDYAVSESSYIRGRWYSIEGRYLEYDGKNFGLGDFAEQISEFKGPRKITSLPVFPLKYHGDPAAVKKRLIERGRKFTALQGMNYRFHKGLAFMKKKKAVLKVNINGRVMIDPALFRRINPNYPISIVRPALESEEEDDDSEGPSDACSCCAGSSGDEAEEHNGEVEEDTGAVEQKTKVKVIYKDSEQIFVEVPVDDDGNEVVQENIEQLPQTTEEVQRTFTDEELLITSPVVLGFAFAEKMWLEFSLDGVGEIEWNEGAFDSLVLPTKQKEIVKALVSSHKFHAAKTIDDVVQGKGRGLVAVLHGPPGTGKTLTAEGIAELLRCPLYMVSAGELGTDPAKLEYELQKILDIAHSWGAVLLLDEADVFLEQREIHDIHRNALVSIFLRLLEYFQGILFLTTNRVATFDEAFQSRIHVALRYEELTHKAKKTVWKMFLDKVQDMEDAQSSEGKSARFTDKDIDALARRSMNGRQIKNATRTAQAMAVNVGARLTMEHIKQVLEVAESFAQDLNGGTGYNDAMRSYT